MEILIWTSDSALEQSVSLLGAGLFAQRIARYFNPSDFLSILVFRVVLLHYFVFSNFSFSS